MKKCEDLPQKLTSATCENLKDSTSVTEGKMSFLEPPAFINENKNFEAYKKDLEMWFRLTLLDKKLQAEMVMYKLEGHPSRIQEKIKTQLGDTLVVFQYDESRGSYLSIYLYLSLMVCVIKTFDRITIKQ